MAGVLGLILLLTTSTLLYFVNKDNDPVQFGSIPKTMYLSVMMLTGQGEPEGDMDSLTQLIVVFTAIGSVAVLAIPASMLAWGFEAEAERLIHVREVRSSEPYLITVSPPYLHSSRVVAPLSIYLPFPTTSNLSPSLPLDTPKGEAWGQRAHTGKHAASAMAARVRLRER